MTPLSHALAAAIVTTALTLPALAADPVLEPTT